MYDIYIATRYFLRITFAAMLLLFIQACSGHKVLPSAMTNPQRGNENAPIVLLYYSDLVCEHCNQIDNIIEDLLKHYPNELKVFFKPVDLHSSDAAQIATRAAIAAGAEGKFWEMHDAIAHSREPITIESVQGFAKTLELSDFDKNYNSRLVDNIVNRHTAQFQRLGGKSLPAVMTHGKLISGDTLPALLPKVVEQLRRLPRSLQ